MRFGLSGLLKYVPWGELLIVSTIVVLSFYYFKGSEYHISADGKGYYEYLPSAFIRHDLNRLDKDSLANPDKFEELKQMKFYLPAGSGVANKYFCGTAVLMSPFFLTCKMFADTGDDGYSVFYQNMMFVSTLFYLFCALIFFRRLLKLFDVSSGVIFVLQILMVFATSTLHYTYNESSFSHVYSLFAVCGFLYFVKAWHVQPSMRRLLFIGIMLGLICIIRPVNVVILLFVPFLFSTGAEFINALKQIAAVRWKLSYPVIAFFAVISIQSVLWYLQCGEFIIYSYGEEGFNFLNPQFFRFLFSWERGAFIYAPVLLLVFPALIYLARKGEYYRIAVWLLFFVVTVYILSSWHAWSYGCSYGQRPMVEFYPALFLPMALFLQRLSFMFRVPVLIIGSVFVYIAVIQTYQYRYFIMHWESMTYERYWSIFLKTDDHYRGYLYRRLFDVSGLTLDEELKLDYLRCEPYNSDTIFMKTVPGNSFDKNQFISVSMNSVFDSDDKAVIDLCIKDSITGQYNYSGFAPKMHFAGLNTGVVTQGQYDFQIPAFNSNTTQIVLLQVFTNEQPAELKDITMKRWK